MLKNTILNLIIIIKALAVGLWFFATGRLFEKLFPKHSWYNIIVTMVLAVVILSVDDGSLSELHTLKDNTVAAAMSMFSIQQDQKHQQRMIKSI